MKTEWKEKWLKALRSGKYKQGNTSLKQIKNRHASYCCLGVLADLAGAKWQQRTGSDARTCEFGNGVFYPAAKETFDISDKEMWHLIDMNDAHNKSFAEIADYIEQNL